MIGACLLRRLLLHAVALHSAAAAALPAAAPVQLGGDSTARLSWIRAFASPGDDWINDIVPLGEDRYLAVGFLGRDDSLPEAARDWRALAVTFTADGEVVSSLEYGAGSGIDAFWSALPASGGRTVFAGFTSRIGAGGIDALASMTDTAGELIRETPLGGPGYDRFTDVAPAGDGHVWIGHSQLPGDDRRRLYAVRTDADGDLVWERIVAGPETVSPLYVEASADGGSIVAGGIGRDENGDMLVLKLDQDGREVWRRRLGSPAAADVNHGLAVLADGRIVLLGYSRSWDARDNDVLAVTLDRFGNVLRQEMIGGTGDDRPILARADDVGRVWVVGSTRSVRSEGSDAFVARLDRDGRFAPGVMTIGGRGEARATAVAPLDDGALLVALYWSEAAEDDEDAYILRTGPVSLDQPHPDFVRREVGEVRPAR